MGECGCGSNIQYLSRMAAPDNRWYVLGVYGGCKDCDCPAGATVDLVNADDLELFECENLPVVCTVEHPNSGVPVVDTYQLRNLVMGRFEERGLYKPEDDIARDVDAEDLDLDDLLRRVVWETVQKFRKESEDPHA